MTACYTSNWLYSQDEEGVTVDGAAGSGSERVDSKAALRPLQSLLVRRLAELIEYAYGRGYELTLGEGYVATPRLTRDGEFVSDGVHMQGSLHYVRLAIDLNLFVNGEYISRSDHFAWIDLGNFWENLDPRCAWGGRFKAHDANHFSVLYDGRR